MLRALVFITLVACDSPEPVAQKPSASAVQGASASVPSLCDKAERLQKRLAGLDTKAARVAVDAGFELPASTTGEEVSANAVVVTIGPKEIRVNGEPLSGARAVKEKVESHGTVLLAIPKGLEGIDRLSDVVSAIGPQRQIYLLASPPGAKVEPPPKGLDLGKSMNERASVLAGAMTKAIATCPEAKKIFQQLSAPGAQNQSETVKRELPGAVGACLCKTTDDLDDIVAYLIAGELPIVAKKLNVSSDKSAKALSLTGLDGQKLYDALSPDGAAVRLEK